MGNYIKDLIQNNQDLQEAEKEALRHSGNLPVLHKHNTKLSELQETIVKAIYLTGGMYIADLKMMLGFSYEVQSVERAVKDLITDDYLRKEKNAYGMLLGLTKEGVTQIKMHPEYLPDGIDVNCQEMSVFGDSAAIKHKGISYAVAEYIFEKRLMQLWNKFWSTEIYERNYYLCKQYLKQIVYRDFLNMTKDNREQFLTDAGFSDVEKELFITGDKYIVWTATKFSELMFIHKGFESIKKMTGYHEYMQIIKRDALNKPSFNTFYLLKDMLSDDDKGSYQELKLLLQWKSTILRFGTDKFRTGIKGNTELIAKEKKLDSFNRCLFVLQNERRSLINKNAYKKKSDEKELGDVLVKLAELDYSVSSIRKEKEILETDFSFAVLKSYDGADNDYETKTVTLQRLAQNAVFVSARSEKEIELFVIQTNEEYFDLFSLHKKMAMGLTLLKRIAPYVQITVRIYTYDADQEDFIERIKPQLINKMLESKETAFYGNLLNDVCTIYKSSEGLKERYIFFQTIKNEMEGNINDTSGSDGNTEESSY